MEIFDISMKIHPQMAVYKNEDAKRPTLTTKKDFDKDGYYESVLNIPSHTGTHIDMPLHMIEGGDTVENLPLEKVVTECKVLDLTGISEAITAESLSNVDIKRGDFILLKTRNSFSEEFDNNFVYLNCSGAKFLAEKGIKGIGIDALGIERGQPAHETHKILFQAEVVILEGLRLAQVPAGTYFLYAAPINIKGAEAAPVRAVLLKA